MRLIRILVCFLFITASAPADEFFVSPGGKDANPGSRGLPFLTLERARQAVRALKDHGIPAAGVTVWIRAGTYSLDSTLSLGPGDSGTKENRVVYSAWPGEEVRISGGRSIPTGAFHQVREAITLARVPAETRNHLLQADLSRLGITNFGKHRQFGHGLPIVPAPLELFINDLPMRLARYPNKGAIAIGEVIDPGSVPRTGDYKNIRGGMFRYADPRHAKWTGAPDIWLHGFFRYGFADDQIRVAAIDTVAGTIKLASPHMYGVGNGEPFNEYVALNLLEELDEPGEWYLDRSRGILFLWPPDGLEGARISVSLLDDPLISLKGVSYLTIQGVILECGRGIGVYMEEGEQNLLIGCVIRNLGTVGVMMGQGARQTFPHITADDYVGVPVSREVGSIHAHAYRNTAWDRKPGRAHGISGCEIYGTGSGGVLLGGGRKKDLSRGGSFVEDCRIHDFDRRNRALAAGVIVDGCGNRVAHNEIFNGDLQAIFVRGNEHVVEYNIIHDVARNSNDASAWYLGRDPSDQGNVVRYNFFHHIGRPDRKWTMGVYCDDATCNVLVEGNVFFKVASYGTVYSNGGHDIVVRNNIFIEGYGPAFQLKSMWYDFGIEEIPYFFGEKGVYTIRLKEAVDIKRPPFSTQYPALTDWLDLLPDGKTFVGMRPRRNVFDRNVLVKYEETFRLVGKYAQCEFGENYITQADPGFVNAAAMDFRLMEEAAVYKELPGFKPIPFEQMGVRKSSERSLP
jgi:hypothetical protein